MRTPMQHQLQQPAAAVQQPAGDEAQGFEPVLGSRRRRRGRGGQTPDPAPGASNVQLVQQQVLTLSTSCAGGPAAGVDALKQPEQAASELSLLRLSGVDEQQVGLLYSWSRMLILLLM